MKYKMGKIKIENLKVRAVIGTLPEERLRRQELIFDLELETDFCKAAETDDLNCAVNYSAVEKAVVETAEISSFLLLEALLAAVWQTVSKLDDKISAATIRITKPQASRFGAMIAVEKRFTRGE